MKIVLASQNVHKLREFREMFKSLKHLDIYSLLDFPKYVPPEETGKTFEENAILKAQHAAKELGMAAIADDSGLVVPSLKGRPGVRSRRYAAEDATDQENNQKLLQEMHHLRDLERAAFYECALAVATPQGFMKCVRGQCEGIILEEGRGSKGFGYDSLFQKHDQNKSFGEIDEGVKNRISHRRKAFEKLSLILESPSFDPSLSVN